MRGFFDDAWMVLQRPNFDKNQASRERGGGRAHRGGGGDQEQAVAIVVDGSFFSDITRSRWARHGSSYSRNWGHRGWWSWAAAGF
jgi:hypothetical protein